MSGHVEGSPPKTPIDWEALSMGGPVSDHLRNLADLVGFMDAELYEVATTQGPVAAVESVSRRFGVRR